MTLAATLDFNLILYIAAAVFGVFSWWNERRKKSQYDEFEKHRQEGQPPAVPIPRATETEQERMRRFMEALGLPVAGTPPAQPLPQPQQQPPPLPPQPRTIQQPQALPMPPRPVVRREPPKVETSQPRPVIKPRPVHPPRQRPVQVKRPVVREESEMADASRLEEPASAIENIGREFEAMKHTAIPALAEIPGPAGRQHNAVFAMLRDRHNVRSAVLLGEILGPPRGAQ